MNVDRIGFAKGQLWEAKEAARAGQTPEQARTGEQTGSEAARAGRSDVCDISPGWEEQVDWEQMLQSYLQKLGSSWSNVDITVADVDRADFQAYAAAKGPGGHLILSTDFLKRMASGADSFYKGKALLDTLAKQLSGQAQELAGVGAYVDETSVTFWAATPEREKQPWEKQAEETQSLLKMMEEMRKRAEENKDKFKVKISSNMFNSPAMAFSMLARASSVPAVKQAMSQADRCICSMKLALALGPEKEKAKIRAAISALEKVITRGTGKIRDLNEEDDLRRRQKRAEEDRQRRRADQFKYELEQRRAKRKVREYGQIVEGQPWFYYQQEMMRKKQIQSPEELGLDGSGAELASMGTGEVFVPEGGAFAPSEVAVAPSIEISI